MDSCIHCQISFFMLCYLLPFLIFFISFNAKGQESKAALYIKVGHSDSLVQAQLRVNGQRIAYDTTLEQYIVPQKLIKPKKNILTISKPGFASARYSIDSIFNDHGLRTEVHLGITLQHAWDSLYMDYVPVKGRVHSQYLMIIHDDSAAVLKAIKGRNLYITKMYDYCGTPKESFIDGPKVNTYLLVHCYGAPVGKQNNTELKELRTILGTESTGPALMVNGSYELLTNMLGIRFANGTSNKRIHQILEQFGLSPYKSYPL
jgi:hypothetical protein